MRHFITIASSLLLIATVAQPSSACDEDGLQLAQFAVARRIEGRQPQEKGDTFSADGQRIYAFVSVVNTGDPSTVTLVWRQGTKVYHRTSVRVGKSQRGWRTWAYIKAMPKLKGAWTVAVEDSEGQELSRLSFLIS